MTIWMYRGVVRAAGPGPVPTPDNDNWRLASEWQTPAEVLQLIRRWKTQALEELREDFSLRACPEHRKTWEITLAMEKCALWHYYRIS
ncbi:MAG: hypothetical protein LC118_10300 [Dehalococcoidia bacterium]|nr:hypothetical protein [Dehalococcoidia bacterium]